MFRRFSANFAVFSIFLDMLVVGVALLSAALLRAPLNVLPFVEKLPPVRLPWVLVLVFPSMWVGVLLLFSVYDGRKNLRVADELGNLTLGSSLAVVALAGVLYLSYRDVSRFLFLMACGVSYILLVSWRLAARMAFRKQGLHLQARRVLIMGAGEIGRRLEKQIRQMPHFGLNLVGFLDDDEQRRAYHNDILGSSDLIRRVIFDHKVDDVALALPLEAHARLKQVVSELYDLPVRVWVIPDYFSITLHRAQVEDFAGIPMLDLRAPALSEYQRMVKRAFDLVVALLAMPVALPVMGLVALAIKLDSPGAVFYRATRAGENGRTFTMIKFRTMIQQADQMLLYVARSDQNGQLVHKQRNDPRVTRVGRFLRKTSLDELPQLFNVVKGEMSLVGPRPEIPELVEKYDLWQRKRFAVPQGMTGWWQVNGRSDKPMHLHTEEDLYYVQNYSIWLDLQILVRTFWVVLRGKGAY